MEDIIQVRAPGVNFYVLREEQQLYLIDGGFVFGWHFLQKALSRKGWEGLRIDGIFLTHGHLDHTWNIVRLQERTGAWVAGPASDELHYQGRYPYRGWSKVCGWLERQGREVLGYMPFKVDKPLVGGETFDVWGGLEAIHLPGHTVGHMGYYCRSRGLLFSGDLFASYGFYPHWPPGILNLCPELIGSSREKVLSLDPTGVLPNHGDCASPEVHLERFKKLPPKGSR